MPPCRESFLPRPIDHHRQYRPSSPNQIAVWCCKLASRMAQARPHRARPPSTATVLGTACHRLKTRTETARRCGQAIVTVSTVLPHHARRTAETRLRNDSAIRTDARLPSDETRRRHPCRNNTHRSLVPVVGCRPHAQHHLLAENAKGALATPPRCGGGKPPPVQRGAGGAAIAPPYWNCVSPPQNYL